MAALDLDAIEARANDATPGPWDTFSRGLDEFVTLPTEDGGRLKLMSVENWGTRADARFAAAARADVPALVAEVRRLRGRVEGAIAEMNAATYGDPETPHRMRVHLDPENRDKTYGAEDPKVPTR